MDGVDAISKYNSVSNVDPSASAQSEIWVEDSAELTLGQTASIEQNDNTRAPEKILLSVDAGIGQYVAGKSDETLADTDKDKIFKMKTRSTVDDEKNLKANRRAQANEERNWLVKRVVLNKQKNVRKKRRVAAKEESNILVKKVVNRRNRGADDDDDDNDDDDDFVHALIEEELRYDLFCFSVFSQVLGGLTTLMLSNT